MKALWLAALLLAGSTTPGLCSGYDDLNAGIQLRNSERWDEAIAAFDKALATKDLNVDQQYIAHLGRARAREAKHDWDGALSDINACITLKTGNRNPLLDRAVFYLRINKPEDAQRDLDALIAINPNDPLNVELYGYRAEAFEMQGDAQKELADLQTEQIQYPDNKDIPWRIGIADLQLGRSAAAAAQFTQSLDFNASYVWLWLAMADLKLGKPVPVDALPHLSKEKWPSPLIDFFQGRSTEEAVNMAANRGDAKTVLGQVCEADFYLGQWRSLHNDAASAKPLIEKAASQCPYDFVEWLWAKEELNHGR